MSRRTVYPVTHPWRLILSITLEQFKAALEGLENGSELLEFFVSSVNSEKERGIAERRAANKEAQNLRKFKLALEKLGFDREETELDTYIEGLLGKLDDKAGPTSELQKQLQKLQREFATTQT